MNFGNKKKSTIMKDFIQTVYNLKVGFLKDVAAYYINSRYLPIYLRATLFFSFQ